MNDSLPRRLPSADWIAFGIGLGALVASFIFPPLIMLVGIAVFAPSVLREVGLLKDADEWTRSVMHRAGFHALLVAALFIGLEYAAPSFHADVPSNGFTPEAVFGGETLRKGVIWTFLISYLIQYWGARTGVFRILLGAAVLNVAPILGFLRTGGDLKGLFILVAFGVAAGFVGLAFLARRLPRAGGGVLAALCVAAFAFAVRNMGDPTFAWAQVSLIFQAFLVLGVSGIALLRDSSS
ncbi:MAG: hypothetical protein AB7V45_07300 [Candidatus Krumholzibacteriia bacterium]